MANKSTVFNVTLLFVFVFANNVVILPRQDFSQESSRFVRIPTYRLAYTTAVEYAREGGGAHYSKVFIRF